MGGRVDPQTAAILRGPRTTIATLQPEHDQTRPRLMLQYESKRGVRRRMTDERLFFHKELNGN